MAVDPRLKKIKARVSVALTRIKALQKKRNGSFQGHVLKHDEDQTQLLQNKIKNLK